VVRRNAVSLGVVTLVYALFTVVMFRLFLGDTLNVPQTSGMPASPNMGSFAAYSLIVSLFGFFLVAVVTYGTVQDLRGRPAGLGDWFRTGLGAALPTCIVAVVWYVIVIVGIILLIIPGIIFMLMLWVVFPVTVMERPGIVGSLRRSAFLTRGNRWRLLGLFLVLAVIMGLLEAGAAFILPFSGPGSFVGSAVSAAVAVFWLVVLGVTYYDLRMAKEGVDIGRVTAVFD
jgi:hypothetical protein